MSEVREDHGWRKLGSLEPMVSPTPESRALTPAPSPERPRSSGTIGWLNPALKAENLIGAALGGTGAFERLRMPAAYAKPDEEPQAERACRHMSNLADPQKSPSPCEPRLVEELVVTVWGPRGGERDRTVMRLLQAFFNHFPRQKADEEVEPMVLNDWLDDLAEFPLYAIRAALTTTRRQAGQWPTISEVVGWAKTYSRQYRRLLEGL